MQEYNNHFNMNNISTLDIHWKDQCWSWSSNTLATLHKEPTHWKRPWYWERLRVRKKETTEDEMVGWNHWQWTRVSANSRRQWSLVCCSSWGLKESGITEQLNNNNKQCIIDIIYVFNTIAIRIYILRIWSFKKIWGKETFYMMCELM